MSVSLLDDGTMDTVFQCDTCGKEIRYSEVDRDEYGYVLESEYERVAEEHADSMECDVRDGPWADEADSDTIPRL